MRRAYGWWTGCAGRVRFAWVLLGGSLIGYPVSAVTFAAGEPPTVLGLSWLAISLTAVDILFTSQSHQKLDAADGPPT